MMKRGTEHRASSRSDQERRRRAPAAADLLSQQIDASLARRVVIEDVSPAVDAGRFPIKRTIGEVVEVTAAVFADGHDELTVRLRDRAITRIPNPESRIPNPESRIPSDLPPWRETRMASLGPGIDRWRGRFVVDAIGWHEYQVIGWVDRFRSWRRALRIKADAGADVAGELLEGSMLIRDAAERAADARDRRDEVESLRGPGESPNQGDPEWLLMQADLLSESSPVGERVEIALGEE